MWEALCDVGGIARRAPHLATWDNFVLTIVSRSYVGPESSYSIILYRCIGGLLRALCGAVAAFA